jgi:hypothetical protein
MTWKRTPTNRIVRQSDLRDPDFPSLWLCLGYVILLAGTFVLCLIT